MKKLVASILIIAMFLNLIQPITVYATSSVDSSSASSEMDEFMNRDKIEIKSKGNMVTEKIVLNSVSGGIIANLIALLGNGLFGAIILLLSAFATDIEGSFTFFTVYDTVFGNIETFNIDYITGTTDTSTVHGKIKAQVETWYFGVRNIAIIVALCMLLYIGIRMALSTLSNDKAKYKKLLIAWLQSFILIFFMHYIILFSIVISKTLLSLLSASFKGAAELTEFKLMLSGLAGSVTHFGWDSAFYALSFWVLAFYQLKFFFLYIKRALAVAFLIIISPLITVTYSIDKAGDRKSTSFFCMV